MNLGIFCKSILDNFYSKARNLNYKRIGAEVLEETERMYFSFKNGLRLLMWEFFENSSINPIWKIRVLLFFLKKSLQPIEQVQNPR
ncbi:hypothetical protein D1609_10540 [Leptospira borgpetersenii serovar Hardjo-bovis]|nr:hypothetical protein B9T54_10615 [Leptospira borgpetersenii serovar Hardjo-bovis]AYR08844.1 hypothetical protein D1609_10540 [Leptospira borgpetersenii serovar Hardjo-bovis]TQE51269.1 hypothetical protein FFZ95_14935 [Leptospira borgpetersenii]TQE53388.1 hypothetical protein FFZ96_15115 [Leptospira borgpetersenii]